MKRLFFILALALPMFASAQKFAHVNANDMIALMVEREGVQQRMDSLQGSYENSLVAYNEEYNKLVLDFQQNFDKLSDVDKAFKQKQIADMEERIKTYYQMIQQDLEDKYAAYMQPIQEKVVKAIQQVGEEKGYTYVFNSAAMVYIAPNATDISADVKAKLGLK